MSENKTKYLVIGVVIVILISLSVVGLNLLKSNSKEEKEKTISHEETRSMLSYTLDGEKTDVKPTKEDGYIANKIICENGSNLVWDNTNWEVEIIKLESNDICSVDFTTNASTLGYRVTSTTNVEGSLDSLSKATIENGTIIFYPNKGQEITGVSGCSNGKLENNKLIVSNITSNQTCNIEVKIPLKTLYVTLSDGVKYTVGARTDFSIPVGGTTITQGYNSTGTIYKIGNDYYFAGNPSDNWVKFANKWWRIIRTNSIEGTRLLYAGTSADGQDGYINNGMQWYSSWDSVIYAQWSYASSTIGKALTDWYGSNITGDNANMVNTNIAYCNDTYVTSRSGSVQYFQAYDNLKNKKIPTYSCSTNSNSTHRNIGLMTADEVAYAGGVFGQNAPNTYYYRNSIKSGCTGTTGDSCSVIGDNYWWTMSPNWYNGGTSVFAVQGANKPGLLYGGDIRNPLAVRPVITLKPSTLVSGSGTASDPFVPSLN